MFTEVNLDMKAETYDCLEWNLSKHMKTIDLIFLIDCDGNATENIVQKVYHAKFR